MAENCDADALCKALETIVEYCSEGASRSDIIEVANEAVYEYRRKQQTIDDDDGPAAHFFFGRSDYCRKEARNENQGDARLIVAAVNKHGMPIVELIKAYDARRPSATSCATSCGA